MAAPRDGIHSDTPHYRTHWLWWGVDSVYSRRKPLLIFAFIFNLAAIACITGACAAIWTRPSLSSIGWASASTTIQDLPQCNNGTAEDSSIEITAWLGLTGFYGQCDGQVSGILRRRTIEPTKHRFDNYCDSATSNLSAAETLCTGLLDLNCELVTIGDPEISSHCSACEDTSNDCVGTLLTSSIFGVFPLVLTIRRFYSVKSERGLRLRTLFFSSLAIILGLHAFVRFHLECVTKMPSSFAALVCSKACNDGDPFLVPVHTDFTLFTGGKLVIIAACLKVSYFTIHLVTPVARNETVQEGSPEEWKHLLAKTEQSTHTS